MSLINKFIIVLISIMAVGAYAKSPGPLAVEFRYLGKDIVYHQSFGVNKPEQLSISYYRDYWESVKKGPDIDTVSLAGFDLSASAAAKALYYFTIGRRKTTGGKDPYYYRFNILAMKQRGCLLPKGRSLATYSTYDANGQAFEVSVSGMPYNKENDGASTQRATICVPDRITQKIKVDVEPNINGLNSIIDVHIHPLVSITDPKKAWGRAAKFYLAF